VTVPHVGTKEQATMQHVDRIWFKRNMVKADRSHGAISMADRLISSCAGNL
jgi:hypothetical protein